MIAEKKEDIMFVRITSMTMIFLCHVVQYYTFIPGRHFLGQILNVGVEIFLIISGFLYGNKTIDNYNYWILKRIQRIWVPIVVLSSIDIVVLSICFKYRFNVLTICAYFFNLQGLLFLDWSFFSKYITEITNLGPMWFMTIIMVCYSLIPLCQRLRDKLKENMHRKEIYLLMIVSFYIISFFVEIAIGIRISYFGSFFVGYILAVLQLEKEIMSNKTVVFNLGVLAIIMQAVRLLLKSYMDGTDIYSSFTPISHVCLGVWLFLVQMQLYKKFSKIFNIITKSKLFIWVDKRSLYIYLTHGLYCFDVFNVYVSGDIIISSIFFVALTLATAFALNAVTESVNKKINECYSQKSINIKANR